MVFFFIELLPWLHKKYQQKIYWNFTKCLTIFNVCKKLSRLKNCGNFKRLLRATSLWNNKPFPFRKLFLFLSLLKVKTDMDGKKTQLSSLFFSFQFRKQSNLHPTTYLIYLRLMLLSVLRRKMYRHQHWRRRLWKG